jgi:phosphoenolpyruvate carboxylase
MDGNPYVNPTIFTEALEKQHRSILEDYARELRSIAPRFSHAYYRAPLSNALRESLDADIAAMQSAGIDTTSALRRREREPYRLKLQIIADRLTHRASSFSLLEAGAKDAFGYAGPSAIAADLNMVAESLRESGYLRSAQRDLGQVRRKLELFGFHGASLDLREDSEIMRLAVRGLLDKQGTTLDEESPEARCETLTKALLQPRVSREPLHQDASALRASRVSQFTADFSAASGSKTINSLRAARREMARSSPRGNSASRSPGAAAR